MGAVGFIFTSPGNKAGCGKFADWYFYQVNRASPHHWQRDPGATRYKLYTNLYEKWSRRFQNRKPDFIMLYWQNWLTNAAVHRNGPAI
jgi:hypothetical protein